MNPDCPACSIHFEREQGYWTMSIFMGYVIYFVVMLPLLIYMFYINVPIREYLIITAFFLVILIPVVFHYGRVIWLHIDEFIDPRPEEGTELSEPDSGEPVRSP